MANEPLSLPSIDNLDIPDRIIEKCKKTYNEFGKEKAYICLDKNLFSDTPSRTFRYLYLYRQAMLQTKASVEGTQYYELKPEPKLANVDTSTHCAYCGCILNSTSDGKKYCSNNLCYVWRGHVWKQSKWAYYNKDATVKVRTTSGTGYTSKLGFRLDDYTYIHAYNDSSLTMKSRASGGIRGDIHFDFEYKYATDGITNTPTPIPEIVTAYDNYVLAVFKEVFSVCCERDPYTQLSPEEIECIFSIINDLDMSYKAEITDFVKRFAEFESSHKDNVVPTDPILLAEYNSMVSKFKSDLSLYHGTLMLPFEFMCWVFCFVTFPKHLVLVCDNVGAIGSKFLEGNIEFGVNSTSEFGIHAAGGAPGDRVVLCANRFHKASFGSTTIYDQYYVLADQNYNFAVYSFLSNVWLSDKDKYPILNKDAIGIDTTVSRKLVSILSYVGSNGNTKISFVFDSGYIEYDVVLDTWGSFVITTSLFPSGSQIIACSYDDTLDILLIVDDLGNIASVSVSTGITTSYLGVTSVAGSVTTMFYASGSNAGVVTGITGITKTLGLSRVGSTPSYIPIYVLNNTTIAQVVQFENGELAILRTLDYANGSTIKSIISLENKRKIFILYENQLTIEFSTFQYNEYILQEAIPGDEKVVVASKVQYPLMDFITYITDKNGSKNVYSIYDSYV